MALWQLDIVGGLMLADRSCRSHARGHGESHKLARATRIPSNFGICSRISVTTPRLREIYHLSGCAPVVTPGRMDHWRPGILERLSSGLNSDTTKPEGGKKS